MKVAGDYVHHSLIKIQLIAYLVVTLLFLTSCISSEVLWFRLGYIVNWCAAAFAVIVIGAYLCWTSKPEEASRLGLKYLGFSLLALAFFSFNLYLEFGQFHTSTPQREYLLGASFVGLLMFIAAALSGWNLIEIPPDYEERELPPAEPEVPIVQVQPVKPIAKPALNYKTPPGLLHS